MQRIGYYQRFLLIKKVCIRSERLKSIGSDNRKSVVEFQSLFDDVKNSGMLEAIKGQKNIRLRCTNFVGHGHLFDTEYPYYFENGLRKVKPYFSIADTFAKERWIGKTLREIYTDMFRLFDIKHIEESVRRGNLLLNAQLISSLDLKVTAGDVISFKRHRHEGAVSGENIEIIANSSKYLVVNKPSGIPIHPVTRFNYNSLKRILERDLNIKSLHTIHRIDMLTSGVCIFAKTKNAAKTFHQPFFERKVQKEYICKVTGVFPEEGLHCNQPITKISRQFGYVVAWGVEGEQSKCSETSFHRISSDGVNSIVLCRPKTGRTHQIRAHLQFLGYPIINDPIYNHHAWGQSRYEYGPCDVSLKDVNRSITDKWKGMKETFALYKSSPHSTVPYNNQVLQSCYECLNPYPDPHLDSLQMCLHAYKYTCENNWSFETEMPKWVK